MEEITNSKKRKREIRNENLRKSRHAKFEKRQRVEKISQFRLLTDFELIVKQLEEGCQKCMSSPLLLTDSILGLNCYPNILVCLTIIISPLYASINSPLQVYETYLTNNIIYYCAIGGCKAGSLNQKKLSVTESNFKAC